MLKCIQHLRQVNYSHSLVKSWRKDPLKKAWFTSPSSLHTSKRSSLHQHEMEVPLLFGSSKCTAILFEGHLALHSWPVTNLILYMSFSSRYAHSLGNCCRFLYLIPLFQIKELKECFHVLLHSIHVATGESDFFVYVCVTAMPWLYGSIAVPAQKWTLPITGSTLFSRKMALVIFIIERIGGCMPVLQCILSMIVPQNCCDTC